MSHDGAMRKALLAVAAIFMLASCGVEATADILPATGNVKVFVCKYTGTPGVDEALQGGGNPISIDYQEGREPGKYFNDAQGRSYVLEYDEGQDEPPVTDCPPPNTGTTTTTSTTSTTSTTTSSTLPPTPGLFAFSAVTATCPNGVATINITFPPRPELNAQVGTLSFSNGAPSVQLTFIASATVQVFYPGATSLLGLTYVLGEETATASVTYPTALCPGGTTTTTTTPVPNTFGVPGGTTTTTVGATTTTAPPGATTIPPITNPATVSTTTIPARTTVPPPVVTIPATL